MSDEKKKEAASHGQCGDFSAAMVGGKDKARVSVQS